MGIRSTIYSKFKGFEDITEELNQAGINQKELEGYNDLYEEYEISIHDLSKISKKESKAEERVLNERKKIEKIQKEMKHLREKAGPLARLKFSRIFFWTKQGKLYRNLKKRLKRATVKQTLAEHELHEYQAKAKGQERTVKQKRKSLKKEQKNIRKMWNQNYDKIKSMKIEGKLSPEVKTKDSGEEKCKEEEEVATEKQGTQPKSKNKECSKFRESCQNQGKKQIPKVVDMEKYREKGKKEKPKEANER